MVDAPTEVISRGDHDRRNKRRLSCGIRIARAEDRGRAVSFMCENSVAQQVDD
jgi:hypothetical protein